MKLVFKLILVVLIGLLSKGLYSQDYRELDNEKGISVKPIMAKSLPLVEEFENKGFEIVRIEFDLIFDSKTTLRNLHKGYVYAIVAFGDYRVADIDIEVYKDVDGKWILIEKDTDEKSTAVITTEPSSKGLYRIDVKVYKFEADYKAGHYGVMILHN